MYAARKIVNFLFPGLATYLGIGEAAAARHAGRGVHIVARYPPRGLFYPRPTKADEVVAVAFDGVLVGYLGARRWMTLANRNAMSGVLTFATISGAPLASVPFVRREGGAADGLVVRYFPELHDGRPRRIELAPF